MKKIVACTVLGAFALFALATDAHGQARVAPRKAAPKKKAAGARIVSPQAPRPGIAGITGVANPVARNVGVINNVVNPPRAASLNTPYVNRAALLSNPGNIYTNNTGSVYPGPFVQSYSYSGNPGSYNRSNGNYGSNFNNGFNVSIFSGELYPSILAPGLFNPFFLNPVLANSNARYNNNLVNSALNSHRPGLIVGVASEPIESGPSGPVGSIPVYSAFNSAPSSAPLEFVPLSGPRAQSRPKDGAAKVHIIAPADDAEVMLDDFQTAGSGRERTFHTPVLEAGYRYGYSVTATWVHNGEQLREVRTVDVFPGRVSLVDFTRPADLEMISVPPRKVDEPQAP
jgi:uncharacterized protein (TIGR03000 family)